MVGRRNKTRIKKILNTLLNFGFLFINLHFKFFIINNFYIKHKNHEFRNIFNYCNYYRNSKLRRHDEEIK